MSHWSREKGFKTSIEALLAMRHPPTALFTQHLAITTDLLAELECLDIRIPDDISLLGFDEVPMADFLKVPITVIEQNPQQIGKEAAELMLSSIGNNRRPDRKIVVPCRIIERASCRKLPV